MWSRCSGHRSRDTQLPEVEGHLFEGLAYSTLRIAFSWSFRNRMEARTSLEFYWGIASDKSQLIQNERQADMPVL
jgi:hypothetical protein